MVQKCSLERVLEVFFKEPTQIHFIKEIAKKIKLAPTSVRINMGVLIKEGLIAEKKSRPFDGFIANRENQKFKDYKQCYNLFSISKIKEKIIEEIAPRAIILFGSYQKGEDIESSDVDVLVLSKIKKEIDVESFEKELNRHIHVTIINEIKDLEKNMQENVKNGWVIYGRA
jgi:predicted nucleotidyltransferase